MYRGKDVSWSHVNRMDSFNGIKYKYNYAGIRTRKTTVDNVITKYYYAGENLLVENNGTRKFTYIYGVDGISGFIVNSYVYYYLKNQLGDVCAIVDASGNIRAKYVYDAFGNHKVLNPDGTENISEGFIGNANPFRYRSYYYDVETGLYYLQSRYYDPETGRFITADVSNLNPYSINKLNLYCYANNKPIGVAYSDSSARGYVSGGMISSIGGVKNAILNSTANSKGRFYLPAVSWLAENSTTIYGSLSSLVSGIPILKHYYRYASNINREFRLYGISKGKASLQLSNVNFKMGALDGVLVGANVLIDMYDSYQRGISTEGIILGGALTAVSGVGMIYLNKVTMWGATAIGTSICPGIGTAIGFTVGLIGSILVDFFLGGWIADWIDENIK